MDCLNCVHIDVCKLKDEVKEIQLNEDFELKCKHYVATGIILESKEINKKVFCGYQNMGTGEFYSADKPYPIQICIDGAGGTFDIHGNKLNPIYF